MHKLSLYALTRCPRRGHPMLNRGRCPKGEPVDRRKSPLSDAGGVAQQPTSARLSYPSTLSVRRRRRRSFLCPLPHGFPLTLLGYHPWLRMVRLRRRHYSVWMWMRRRCSEGVAQQLLLPMHAHFPPHLQCEVSTKIRNTHLRILRRAK